MGRHVRPPEKSKPTTYLPFNLLQKRTVPLPPNAKQSALKQTLVLNGIGSEISIRNPVREMFTHSPVTYLSKLLVQARRMAPEHGWRLNGCRRWNHTVPHAP